MKKILVALISLIAVVMIIFVFVPLLTSAETVTDSSVAKSACIKTYNAAIKTANTTYTQAVKTANNVYSAAVKTNNQTYKNDLAKAAADYKVALADAKTKATALKTYKVAKISALKKLNDANAAAKKIKKDALAAALKASNTGKKSALDAKTACLKQALVKPTVQSDWRKKIPHFSVLKTKTPITLHLWAITEKISAAEGGEVSVTDPKGTLIKLTVPAGALSQDTEITLTPLDEVPIENYTSVLGNGVLIAPEGLKFSKNAILTFDFKPYEAEGGFSTGQAAVLNTLPKTAGVIHIDSIKGKINNTDANLSEYGSKLFVNVSSLSSFVPDDLGGKNGDSIAESELPGAADLGVCSQQFLRRATRMIEYDQAVGNGETAKGIFGILQNCGKSAVDDLEKRCKENPMQVRRKDFLNILEVLQAIGPESEVTRLNQLMIDCRREYTISASKTEIVQQGTSIYSIDAKLCGYLDEKWKGNEVADYTLLYSHQRFEGAVTFTLPQNGGKFDMTTSGQLVAQTPLTEDLIIPYSGQGMSAFYDDQKKITVHYHAYGIFDVEAPIIVANTKCESTNR